MAKVTALKMDVVTDKSNHQSVPNVVDVCMTPAAAGRGPIPIPYANIIDGKSAANNSKAKVTQKKIIKESAKLGCHANSATGCALKLMGLQASSGDEPASQGVISSAINKGKSVWVTYSMDVNIEDKSAPRVMSLMNKNKP